MTGDKWAHGLWARAISLLTASTARRTSRSSLSKRPGGVRKLTNLNADVMAGKQIAETESFTFVSNDNQCEVEAFLTKPLGMTATSKHPMIVDIHGGPHWRSGPEFDLWHQVFAARGWATLMVNYRGSTGY